MTEAQTFGKWLRHRRRELDLTQDELARQTGCAAITIRKLEADEMRPSKQLAEALIKHLELPIEERERYLRFARGDALATVTPIEARNNLPHFISSFVGRQRELAEIEHLMSMSRLVTLTGAGGCGKTRLAIEVARRQSDQFSDGVWLIDFVPLREFKLILQTIASTLGVREEPNRPLSQTLSDYLFSRNLLLLFDNCEHLVTSCAEIAGDLLRHSPQLHILCTSREALGVAGEAQYHVPSLSLPAPGEVLSADRLNEFEALRLFVERAESIQPASASIATSPEAIAQICRRLDGIPLAIELAAARVKTLTVEHIANRLDDRFNLLTTGNRSALPRHQTLRATLDWSYDLLSDPQRRLLRRLSVFRGGWTLEAAETVCADEAGRIGDGSVFDLCSRLIDQSLLLVEHRRDGERYNLLETIREYARERLVESGEEEQIRKKHLTFYVGFAEQAELNYRGGEQKHWFDLVENDRDNLRSSMEYALRTSPTELAPRLIAAAFWLWFFRGPWSEGQGWVAAALGQISEGRTVFDAKLFMAMGLLNFAQSDYSASLTALEKSLAMWRALDDKWWQAFVLDFIALIVRVHDPQAAAGLFRESLEMAESTQDGWILAFSLWNSGENELNRQNLAGAQPLLERSLQLCESIGDKLVKHEVLRTLGEMAEAGQEYLRAVRLYEESLAVVTELEAPNISMLHLNLGRALQLTGDDNKAGQHFMAQIELSRQIGDRASLLRAFKGMGVVAAASGQAHRAVCLMAAADMFFDNLGYSFTFNPNETAWLKHHFDAARSSLGHEGFSEAMKEGQSMTLDQAVRYALGRA